MYPHHAFGMGGWLGAILGGIFLLLLLVGFVILIVAAIRSLSRGSNGKSSEVPKSRSLEVLKERYAKGEISREEYQRIKEDLES